MFVYMSRTAPVALVQQLMVLVELVVEELLLMLQCSSAVESEGSMPVGRDTEASDWTCRTMHYLQNLEDTTATRLCSVVFGLIH